MCNQNIHLRRFCESNIQFPENSLGKIFLLKLNLGFFVNDAFKENRGFQIFCCKIILDALLNYDVIYEQPPPYLIIQFVLFDAFYQISPSCFDNGDGHGK